MFNISDGSITLSGKPVPRNGIRKLSAPSHIGSANNKKPAQPVQPPTSQITDDTPLPISDQDRKYYQENDNREVKFLKPLPIGMMHFSLS